MEATLEAKRSSELGHPVLRRAKGSQHICQAKIPKVQESPTWSGLLSICDIHKKAGNLAYGISWRLEAVPMVQDLSFTGPTCCENTGGPTGCTGAHSDLETEHWNSQRSCAQCSLGAGWGGCSGQAECWSQIVAELSGSSARSSTWGRLHKHTARRLSQRAAGSFLFYAMGTLEFDATCANLRVVYK